MNEHLFALVVHDQPEAFDSLRRTLNDLSVETYAVATCQEAQEIIAQRKPQMIFTERSLRDGSWQTILRMVEAACVPVCVIVVGSVSDTRFHSSVMEGGAFDFIAPPFEHGPLKLLVRSAALNTYVRRKAMAPAAVAE